MFFVAFFNDFRLLPKCNEQHCPSYLAKGQRCPNIDFLFLSLQPLTMLFLLTKGGLWGPKQTLPVYASIVNVWIKLHF